MEQESEVSAAQILVGGAILFAAALAAWSFISPEESSPEHPRPVIRTTLDQLVAEFEKNEVGALAMYEDTTVELDAVVKNIQSGPEDRPFVNLAWDDTLLPVQATFFEDQVDYVASLSPGDAIVLRCDEVTEVLGTPMLGDCWDASPIEGAAE